MKIDILIMGGGHAGIEAAHIASKFNFNIVLVSSPEVDLGSMPCNPAIGGVGKGQVVREIDALGGLMGTLADESAIQMRILNESKGHAVQSTRSQVDKAEYVKAVKRHLTSLKKLTILRHTVLQIEKKEGMFHVELSDHSVLMAQKLIVTTGTFLAGQLHCGAKMKAGGRIDCKSSLPMNDLFAGVATSYQRFKTGTPPRLKKDTIDFSRLIEQTPDHDAESFSFKYHGPFRKMPQVSCYISHTNAQTLEIIRLNKGKSPLYNGQVTAIGPRYCPSIEDKAFRYPDRDIHHIFLEPEGISLETIYPSGLSTSLPEEIQLQFLRTIVGLEKVEIAVPGHAVEYDIVDTSKLSMGLEYENISGLYFAGQVNGTSGYEEAAGQGIIAGINAVFALQGKKIFTLSRYDSYIGVMIEDLVSSTRDEPYRLFTARSENRLYIREDNTVERISKYRKQLGLWEELDSYQNDFLKVCSIAGQLMDHHRYLPTESNKKRFNEKSFGALTPNMTLSDLVKRAILDPVKALAGELAHLGLKLRPEEIRTLAITKKYAGYIQRSDQENLKLRKYDEQEVDWEKVVASANISFECKGRIKKIRPKTFSQLKRIEGIRPATLLYVVGNLL